MDAGFQPSDTDMAEAGQAAAGQAAAPAAAAPPPPGLESIQATLSHGGRFIQYNIFGNIFEVTSKYKPPIMPIGKGAYGIVWYSPLCLDALFSQNCRSFACVFLIYRDR